MQDMDIVYIRRCFELALKGLATASPNPMVGCVIVRDGKILAEGFHQKRGMAHAEKDALDKIDDASGATLYCNLEPCCHDNKTTAPCVPLIIKKGITKVVVSNIDPNPNVAGKGLKLLHEAGIEVVSGLLEKDGQELNKAFFTSMKYSRPLITLKFAQTLDGKMATLSGDSKWISSESSRKRAHELRLSHDAILIGSGTLNADDPQLNIRYGIDTQGKVPWRIVVGDPAKMNPEAKLFNDEYKDKTIIVTTRERVEFNNSINIIKLKAPLNWSHVWIELHKLEIRSVLVEGGPKVLSSVIEQNAFDRVEVFIAPRILGDGIAISGRAENIMKNTIQLSGEDIHLSAWRDQCSQV